MPGKILSAFFVLNVTFAAIYVNFIADLKMDPYGKKSTADVWIFFNKRLGFANIWGQFLHINDKQVSVEVIQSLSDKSERKIISRKSTPSELDPSYRQMNTRQIKGIFHAFAYFADPAIMMNNTACYFCEADVRVVNVLGSVENGSWTKLGKCSTRN